MHCPNLFHGIDENLEEQIRKTKLQTWSSFNIFLKGDNPDVMCSGSSENAFKNPFWFLSRYSLVMKAVESNAVTLSSRAQ